MSSGGAPAPRPRRGWENQVIGSIGYPGASVPFTKTPRIDRQGRNIGLYSWSFCPMNTVVYKRLILVVALAFYKSGYSSQRSIYAIT